MTRRLAVAIPLALFIAFVAVAIFGLGTPQNRPVESRLVGEPVPQFALPGLNAEHPGLSSAELRGQVTLVNLFGSWCLPCRVEAPQLERLEQAGATIHAVAIRDRQEDVEEFLTRYGDPFQRIGMDPGGTHADRARLDRGAGNFPRRPAGHHPRPVDR